MLQALIHGKLSRTQENLEDVLTSNIFGLIKYFPPQQALFPFLSKAKNLRRKTLPLSDLPDDVRVEYKFWPPFSEEGCKPCEPDVVIRIYPKNESQGIIIFIEAKYRSGKSSYEDESEKANDQLAREWSNLKRISQQQKSKPYLVYLTPDFSFPTKEIEDSQNELLKKNDLPGDIYWLSWRHFQQIPEIVENDFVKDIVIVLRDRLGLVYYSGIYIDERNIPKNPYKFTKTYSWKFEDIETLWNF